MRVPLTVTRHLWSAAQRRHQQQLSEMDNDSDDDAAGDRGDDRDCGNTDRDDEVIDVVAWRSVINHATAATSR
jgi:hypothetical protein